jgi:hypothetical protein
LAASALAAASTSFSMSMVVRIGNL